MQLKPQLAAQLISDASTIVVAPSETLSHLACRRWPPGDRRLCGACVLRKLKRGCGAAPGANKCRWYVQRPTRRRMGKSAPILRSCHRQPAGGSGTVPKLSRSTRLSKPERALAVSSRRLIKTDGRMQPTCTCGPYATASMPRCDTSTAEAGVAEKYACSGRNVRTSHTFTCASAPAVTRYRPEASTAKLRTGPRCASNDTTGLPMLGLHSVTVPFPCPASMMPL